MSDVDQLGIPLGQEDDIHLATDQVVVVLRHLFSACQELRKLIRYDPDPTAGQRKGSSMCSGVAVCFLTQVVKTSDTMGIFLADSRE